jgi:DNA-binding GntR family transcriptional regulator
MNKDIYHQLHQRIIHLDYPPGQILKEQQLAGEFGVSRTPLRTVLFRLEWEHLIRILPRTGIQVMELELNTITHVFQARLELEAVIGTLAAQRFTVKQRDALQHLEAECHTLKAPKDPLALGHLDMNVKKLFHDACANPFLVEMSDRLYALTYRLWYFNMLNMDLPEWENEVDCLQEDLTALSGLLALNCPADVGTARKEQLLKHLKRIRSTFLGLSE